MNTQAQHLFLANFTTNEVCVVPAHVEATGVYDWYPVAIEANNLTLHDIIARNFGTMSITSVETIPEFREKMFRQSAPASKIFKLAKRLFARKRHDQPTWDNMQFTAIHWDA